MRYIRYFYVFAWLIAVALYAHSAFVPDVYAIRSNLLTTPLHDFFVFSLVSGVESMILAAVIRPWSFRGSRGRLLVAFTLFAPWAGLCLFTLMHQSPFLCCTCAVASACCFWLGVGGTLRAPCCGLTIRSSRDRFAARLHGDVYHSAVPRSGPA